MTHTHTHTTNEFFSDQNKRNWHTFLCYKNRIQNLIQFDWTWHFIISNDHDRANSLHHDYPLIAIPKKNNDDNDYNHINVNTANDHFWNKIQLYNLNKMIIYWWWNGISPQKLNRNFYMKWKTCETEEKWLLYPFLLTILFRLLYSSMIMVM